MILVTGGLGMIGAHAAAALADRGEEVLVTAHRTVDVPEFLRGRVTVVNVDVADERALFELGGRYDIGGIVHLAGSIPAEDPTDFLRHDLTALVTALKAARAWKVSRFAVASSIGVYTGRAEEVWNEELELPTTVPPHAIVALKKAAEPLTLSALAGTEVRPLLLRIGSTWGPLMDPESPFNVIPPMVGALQRGEQPAALFADDGGDFGYAPDTGRAIALLMTASDLKYAVYNVSAGRRFTNREIVDALHMAFPDRRIPLRPGRSIGAGSDAHLDIARLRADTGFEPEFDPAAAIAHYVAWRRANRR